MGERERGGRGRWGGKKKVALNGIEGVCLTYFCFDCVGWGPFHVSV